MLGRKNIRTRHSGQDNLFGWTIFLILLAAFAAAGAVSRPFIVVNTPFALS